MWLVLRSLFSIDIILAFVKSLQPIIIQIYILSHVVVLELSVESDNLST
jgi:hypothetical protein